MYELLDCDKSPKREMPEKEASVSVFIHSVFDDYPLDVYEFRVYCHIVRRTGSRFDGVSFGAVATMAEVCGMSTRKVQYALKVLIACRFIRSASASHRRTNTYKLNPPAEWVSSEEVKDIRTHVKGTGENATEKLAAPAPAQATFSEKLQSLKQA